MRTLLNAVSVLSLCASSFVLGGCEVTDCKTDEGKDAKCAESLKAYEAADHVVNNEYVVGASITIKGVYGDIGVLPGDAGTVETTFKGFNYRGNSQETDARRELDENLDTDVVEDADGNLTITTGRHDATNGLGSHITVRLPPEFNGTLIVENDGDGILNPGTIDLATVANATTLNVVNHGLGLCKVLEGDPDEIISSKLTDVDVRCEASIIVRGVHDNVVVKALSPAFHSDVIVEILSISADAVGGSITGEDASVQVTLPLAGDYQVMASALGTDARMNKVEAGDCTTDVSEDKELQLTCGAGGPVYEISAADGDAEEDPTRLNVYVR